MKITPVKDTNDYLPAQAELRDYLQRKICETYENCGFQRIFTPILEDIENLDKSEGGDNLNLIFKVMKRGEKLEKAIRGGDPLLVPGYCPFPESVSHQSSLYVKKSLT